MSRLSGLDQLLSDARVRPGMSHLTGLDFVSAEPGRAEFTLPVTEWLLWSHGEVLGGVIALLADAASGCALQTALPVGAAYTTAMLSLTCVRRAHAGSTLRGVGRLIHAGRTLGLSDVEISDSDGRLIAHGVARSMIFPPGSGLAEGRAGGTTPPPLAESIGTGHGDGAEPDPYLRPVAGSRIDAATLRRLGGAGVLAAQISGELPLPPLHHLVGLTPDAIGEGSGRCLLPLSGWLATPWGWPQGGFVALAADAALAMAASSVAPHGTDVVPVDVAVNFVRPVATATGELTADARIVHRGRTLIIGEAVVTGPDGRPVALARGSAGAVSGRS